MAVDVHRTGGRDPSLEIASPVHPRQDSVRVEHAGEVTVLTPLETLNDPLADDILREIDRAAARGALVVDLSEVTLVDRAPAMGLTGLLAAAFGEQGRACLVCRRGSGRGLLRAWGVNQAVAVFDSVGDALQSRRFERDGYGPGWRPSSGPLARGRQHPGEPPQEG